MKKVIISVIVVEVMPVILCGRSDKSERKESFETELVPIVIYGTTIMAISEDGKIVGKDT